MAERAVVREASGNYLMVYRTRRAARSRGNRAVFRHVGPRELTALPVPVDNLSAR
jgi:hypothetical protein